MKVISVIAMVCGVLGLLGAVANFHFTFGVEQSAMLIGSAFILAAGLIALAVTFRSRPAANT